MNKSAAHARICAALLLLAGPSHAGEADVVAVQFEHEGGSYTFHVTVRHDDTGWEHYADRWEILSPDGQILATRTLLHPHVDEQPFTRSISGVALPEGMTKVVIRAHDKIDGYGGREISVDLADGSS